MIFLTPHSGRYLLIYAATSYNLLLLSIIRVLLQLADFERRKGLLEHFLGAHPLNEFPGQKWLATARTGERRF